MHVSIVEYFYHMPFHFVYILLSGPVNSGSACTGILQLQSLSSGRYLRFYCIMYTIGSGIYQIILSRIEKYATCASDSYDDICGGNLYKHLSSDRDSEHYVTFTFNTDGVPVYINLPVIHFGLYTY